MRRITNHYNVLFFLLVLGGLLLAACSTQEPLQVIITPTPDPEVVTPTATATIPVLPTATPTLPEGVEPSATFRGPVIGEGYQLPTLPPPTAFIPTATPEPAVSDTPAPPPTPTHTPGPTMTPLPSLDASRIGIQLYSNLTFDEWMQVVGLSEGTGVGWVKMQVDWGFLQPNGPNEFNDRMALFERQVEAIARPGFNVMLSVAKAPLWARSDGAESGPPDDPQLLADFITFMLRDTKIGAAVDAVEIWNEPNLIREWRGTLEFSGAGYMRLFRPAYEAVRAYSPTMTIITAGLAPTATVPGQTVDDRLFMQQMYDAGLEQYRDIVIGTHPYGWGNPPDARCCDNVDGLAWDDDPRFFFLENLQAYRDIMNRNGHGDIQQWVTEFGWATWEGIPGEPPDFWMTYNTAQEQADYTIRALEIGLNTPGVGVMILWNLNFANPTRVEQGVEQTAYSIINPVLSVRERPLFWALAEVTGRLDN